MVGASDPHEWVPTCYELRDTWFAIAHSVAVGTRPLRRIVHSQPYFIWRDNGHLQAAEFHPQRPTASGTYTEFTAGSGYYPVVERFGYVWAWYGNPDVADVDLIPDIPFLPRDGRGIPGYMHTTVRFDGCSSLSVENLLDLTHADFLHGEVIGGEGEADSDEVTFECTSETLTRTRWVVGKPVSPIMRWVGGVRTKYQEFRSTLHVHLRNNMCISYPRFRPGFDIPNAQPFIPNGSYRSLVNQIFNLNAAPTPFRQVMPRMAYTIGPQDNYAVRPQNPRYLEGESQTDFHSRFDAPGVRYRHLMKKLWQRQAEGDFSYLADSDPGGDITTLLGMENRVE
ncbi:oxygenase [Pseudomaricurvus alkylphenolicus]|nr:oxygenase [Pseudomaricurvus alkylphenolicus]